MPLVRQILMVIISATSGYSIPKPGSYKQIIPLSLAENLYRIPYLKAPVVDKAETTHFILKVTDKGNPPLTRYKRVIVNILPL